MDYEAHGVSLCAHPMEFLRTELDRLKITPTKDLKKLAPKRKVTVGGMVICRQMPGTSKGVLFVTLEDEFGFANLVVWPKVYERFKETLLTHSFLVCRGVIQVPDDAHVIHIIAEDIQPLLSHQPSPSLMATSHDWH